MALARIEAAPGYVGVPIARCEHLLADGQAMACDSATAGSRHTGANECGPVRTNAGEGRRPVEQGHSDETPVEETKGSIGERNLATMRIEPEA